MSKAVVLSARSVLKLSGPDARNFLQGLITNNIEALKPGEAIYAALLTPQGKIIADFLITEVKDTLLIDCAASQAANLAERLRKYKLRAKVAIEDLSATHTVLSVGHRPTKQDSNVVAFFDPRLPALGARWIVQTENLASLLEKEQLEREPFTTYERHRIECGVPDTDADLEAEAHFPLDCNFEELHGVDFNKGCYVGQELTARMKHRATSRRRILPVSGTVPLPPRGSKILASGIEAGEMLGAQGLLGLALLRLDKLAGATTAECDGKTLHIGQPPYTLLI